MFEFEISGSVVQDFPATRIAVLGVGGAGNNTINALVNAGRCDYNCVAINTDAQALELSRAPLRIRIGTETTRGRGAGADPALGKAAAEENIPAIMESLKGMDIVFLIGGLGGGTGSGALPVIAHALKEQEILTICIVTKPFSFEGKRRALIAEQAEELLKKSVDTLIVIPNEKLLYLNREIQFSWTEACGFVNGIIGDCIHGITDIIMKPGHINVDLSDIKTIMKGQGTALMGSARAQGEDRAQQAAHAAISSPFLDNLSMKGARNVLINITGDHSLGLHEIQQAAARITEDCDEQATIIIGSVIDEAMGKDLSITVIATGFNQNYQSKSVEPVYHPFLRQPQTEQTSTPIIPQKREQRPVETQAHALTKESSLRDVLPSLEKRFSKEQYTLSFDDLETPTVLRKLNTEQNNSGQ